MQRVSLKTRRAPIRGLFEFNILEATTGVEPVMAVLQTAALTTWLRRPGAGDGIRTRDIQLGKLTLYH